MELVSYGNLASLELDLDGNKPAKGKKFEKKEKIC